MASEKKVVSRIVEKMKIRNKNNGRKNREKCSLFVCLCGSVQLTALGNSCSGVMHQNTCHHCCLSRRRLGCTHPSSNDNFFSENVFRKR